MIKPFKFRKLPSHQKQIEIIAYLSAVYNVEVKLKKCRYAGVHVAWKGKDWIVIDKDDIKDPLITMFHELGHSYCFRNGIWSAIHNAEAIYRNGKRTWSTDVLKRKIRTGLKVERYVDKWARAEMKKWFPYLKYKDGYLGKNARKWYHENWLYQFKDILKRRKK